MLRTTRIGEHRGKPRIWLEGQWLHKAGWPRYTRFNIETTGGIVKLIKHDTGTHAVSGKVKNNKQVSVIDINRTNVGQAGKTVDVLIEPNSIVIG